MSMALMAAYMRMRPAEQEAYREHQRRIQAKDRNKRRRAVREYRTWLDYLVSVGRITPGEATEMEHYRIAIRNSQF